MKEKTYLVFDPESLDRISNQLAELKELLKEQIVNTHFKGLEMPVDRAKLAKIMGVSTATIKSWEAGGYLHGGKFANRTYFFLSAIINKVKAALPPEELQFIDHGKEEN